MLAVKFPLKSFVKEFSNVSIKIFIDNTTVISFLKNMETYSFHLNSICKQIWEWCKDRNIWLLPVYINTKQNLADRSSRITFIQAEWMLKHLFDRVLKTLKFSPTIDLFASRLNHQLPTYVSYKPDPNPYAVDAFSLVWKQFTFYCFPPFSCITECLQKIKKEESEGLLIVPQCSIQPFYSQLLQILKQEPMIIQANAKNLYIVQFSWSTIKISNSSKDRFNGMFCTWQKLINDGLSK